MDLFQIEEIQTKLIQIIFPQVLKMNLKTHGNVLKGTREGGKGKKNLN